MPKLKILYCLNKKEHRRVYGSFTNDFRVEQAVAVYSGVPKPDLKLKMYKYDGLYQLSGIIREYRPNIFIQCDLFGESEFSQLAKYNIRRGYINHGIWPRTKRNMKMIMSDGCPKFDLACVGSNMCKSVISTKSNKTIINAMPQIDLLYATAKRQAKIKKELVEKSSVDQPIKIITLFGEVSGRKTIYPYNYGFYATVIELEQLARKYNWLVIIKPKNDRTKNFIRKSKEKWAQRIRAKYSDATKSRYVHFANVDDDPYKYFCSDLVICSSPSTIEVESSLVRMPVIRIMFSNCTQKYTNAIEYGSIEHGAVSVCNDVNNLGKMIHDLLYVNIDSLYEGQNKFITSLGMIMDGNAHTRVVDGVISVLRSM